MLSKIKIIIKKILFGFALIHFYITNRSKLLKKSFLFFGQRSIYESKTILWIFDKLFVGTNQISSELKTNKQTEKNHIIICLTGILNPKFKSNASLYYLWANLYLNANSGNKVTFFNTNEHVYLRYFFDKNLKPENQYFEDFKKLGYLNGVNKFNYQTLDTNTLDLKENISKACVQICKLRPTQVVFFSGWNCDSPLVRKVLFKVKPIIYHVTHDAHLLPNFAHLMVVASKKNQWMSNKKIPEVDVDNYFMGNKESLPKDINENIEVTSKFKEGNDPVTIATIVSGKRIIKTLKSYTDKELNILFDFIELNDVIWHFIGVNNVEDFSKISERVDVLKKAGKLKIVKLMTPIDPFLNTLDIYCSMPKLIGGSGIALNALRRKIVLISDSHSDINRMLEAKYIYDDYLEFFEALQKLADDANLRVKTMISQNLYLNRYTKEETYKITAKKLERAESIFLDQ